MVSLKGLNNNIYFGRLITVRPLFWLPGLAWVFTLSFALTGVNVKTVLWYMHLQIGKYIIMTLKGRMGSLEYGRKKTLKCAKISLRQKVSSPESAKICLRQNFSFYSNQKLVKSLWMKKCQFPFIILFLVGKKLSFFYVILYMY